jgi:hypothetical protein
MSNDRHRWHETQEKHWFENDPVIVFSITISLTIFVVWICVCVKLFSGIKWKDERLTVWGRNDRCTQRNSNSNLPAKIFSIKSSILRV